MLSLDVEGAELEVLRTLDFDKHQFGVIFYEADEHDPVKNVAMKTLLADNGYDFVIHSAQQFSREQALARDLHFVLVID